MADKKTLEEIINLHKQNIEQTEREIELRVRLTNSERERLKLNREYYENERAISDLLNVREEDMAEATKEAERLESRQKEIVKTLEKEERNRVRINNIQRHSNILLREGWKYLMDSDKTIKSTILNLGMSGAKAEMMRSSFEGSAQFVARLGGTLADVKSIMEGYADTTGRARALSEETVKSVMAIGKGTGLGVEEATKLASQFEFMGKDATSTLNYVQGVVDTSERMGVNTTKVLKDVSTNFKKLSTFTFQGGTKAFAQMAIDAERTRLSMETTLNVAEATRGLESVIELGANLQVMGGEFAKMDPLHWMYIARNEPEKLNNMISEMTKGLFTLRKTSDGTFERFISPADRDRLANVAKSLGISNEEMFQMAQRSAEISSMQRDLSRLGLNKEQQELVEGIAKFDSKSGKMVVEIGRTAHAVSDLTSEQIKLFATEQKTLEERAKEARTFDETFRATINELKASLLPLLDAINGVLKWAVPKLEWIADKFNWLSQNWGGLGAALSGAGLITAAILLKSVTTSLGFVTKNLVAGLSKRMIGRKAFNAATAAGTTTATGVGGMVTTATGKPNIGATKARDIGRANRMRAAGARNLKTGAGVGLAAAGIGAGAMGIAQLAKAVKDVDVEKLKQMNISLAIMGGTMAILGTLGRVAGKSMLYLGGGIALVGAGIAAGAMGMAQLAKAIKGVDVENLKQMNVSLGILAGTMTILGLVAKTTSKGMLSFGAGIALIGAGIGAGAMGMAQLAKAIKDVDVENLRAMNGTLAIMGGTMIGLGLASKIAGGGMLVMGAGIVLVGAGIAAGAMGIAELTKAIKNIDVENLRAMNGALAIMGGTMIGLGLASKIAGGGMLAMGAGVALIGAGIAAGAMGMAQLAKAIKDVDVKNLKQMNIALGIMAATIFGLGLAASLAAPAVVPVLLSMGVAAVSIGAGIGAAAYGMSFLSESLGNLSEKVTGSQLFGIASGILAIAGATATMANPLTLGGMGVLMGIMGAMHVGYKASAKSAENIANMATAMAGTKEDFLAVERAVNAINSLDRKNSGIFSELANIMKQPLKVEFADNNAVFRSDITLEIDKSKFMNKVVDIDAVVRKIERRRINKPD